MRALLIAMVGLGMAGVVQAVDIDWVTVGDPGNACDEQPPNGPIPGGCFGTVDYTYLISKYEVTNSQYAEFLNAVAGTDTYGLYNDSMDYTLRRGDFGGILQIGTQGSFTYIAIAGREDMPVNHVSFWDALRFANWLHNGQATGAQDSTTTEDGAYTLDGYTSTDGSWIVRNAEAIIVLPSEDEWFKAAYYAGADSYFDYPTSSDTEATCWLPSPLGDTANCGELELDDEDLGVVGVGVYTGSAGPSGTFDQGGNVWEWNEGIGLLTRGVRGGGFSSDPEHLAASSRNLSYPAGEGAYFGFRVASVPEPTQALLCASALATLALLRRRESLSSPT